MKAYITCPVSHSKERIGLLPEIKEIVDENALESFVFEVGGNPDDIFRRDYDQLKSCDLIIAEVSETSHGVGIEIGISYCLGLKRILLFEKGKYITKLVQGMPNTTLIEYEGIDDMKARLSTVLKNIA